MKIRNLQNLIYFIFIIIIIFLLAYTFYKSEIIFNGSLRNKYNFYYILLSFTLFFLIFTFFLKKENRNKILLLIFSLIISLYIIEAFLTHIEDKRLIAILKNFESNKNTKDFNLDKRSRLEFYKDRSKINKDIVLSVTPNMLTAEKNLNLYPLSGISNRETIMCNENGYYSIYNSDRYGFNNPDYEWDSKFIDYLFIGDSYTHGACVNPGENIPDHLRKISNKSVLNLGMGGNGTLIEYATLKEYADNKSIKNLILIFNLYDLKDIEIEKNNFFLKKYFDNENYLQNLKLKQKIIDEYLINFQNNKMKQIETYKYNFLKLVETRSFIKKALAFNRIAKLDQNIDYKLFREILKKIKHYTDTNNINFSIVYLYQYGEDLNHKEKIKNILKRLDINFIDTHEEIFKNYEDMSELLSYYLPLHYNSNGYKLIADLIYKELN